MNPDNEHIRHSSAILNDPARFSQLSVAHQLEVICTEKTKAEALVCASKALAAEQLMAIKLAEAAVVNPLKERVRLLKEQGLALVTANRAALMDGKKTKEVCGQSVGFRLTKAVDCEDEDDAVTRLDLMAADETASDDDRRSAEACLNRPRPKIDKNFVLKVAKHSAAWLRQFSLFVTEVDKLNIKPISTKEDDES